MQTAHYVPFNAEFSFKARAPFTFNGCRFQPGDDFPGDKVPPEAVTDRRLRQMHQSRLIVCEWPKSAEPITPPVEPPKAPPATPQPAKAALVASTQGKEADGEYTTAHVGFGRFNVLDPSGAIVLERVEKKVATTEASRLNETRRGAGGLAGTEGLSAPSGAGQTNSPA